MNEGKPGGKNEMLRNAKTRIWRVRFCPPEHINMLSGRTRTSHPGGQGRVTLEDKIESPRVTRASHPGGQGRVTEGDKGESPGRTRTSHPGGRGRVTREDKGESSGRTESDVKT